MIAIVCHVSWILKLTYNLFDVQLNLIDIINFCIFILHVCSTAPPSPLTVSQHEITEQSHIGMHTLGRNHNR